MIDDEDNVELGPAPTGWTGSTHEMVETAHLACRAAWLWPEDDEQRQAAVLASAQCGVDYLDRLERLVKITTGPTEHAIDFSRRSIAESFRQWADEEYIKRERGAEYR